MNQGEAETLIAQAIREAYRDHAKERGYPDAKIMLPWNEMEPRHQLKWLRMARAAQQTWSQIKKE